jgi:hypothetical protein
MRFATAFAIVFCSSCPWRFETSLVSDHVIKLPELFSLLYKSIYMCLKTCNGCIQVKKIYITKLFFIQKRFKMTFFLTIFCQNRDGSSNARGAFEEVTGYISYDLNAVKKM